MALHRRHRYVRDRVLLNIHLHGMWGVFLNEFFRRIATSLIGLFIPVYIWQETGELYYIPIYFLIYSASALSTELIGAKMIRKVGVDWGMAIGSMFRAMFIFLLVFARVDHNFFWISAFCFGVAQPFDWLPYHYVVVKVSKKMKHFGKSASYSAIVTQLASAISPIIGGFLIVKFGYTTLYSVAGSFLIVSVFMAFLDDFEKKGMHVSGKEVVERFCDKGILKHVYSYFLKSLDSWVYVMIWPIFLYTAIGTIEGSGRFQTISLVVALIVTFLTGKFVDKKNFKMMVPGSILVSLSWVGRILAKTNFVLFVVDMAYNVGLTILWTPHDALIYSRSIKKYTMEFILVREIIIYLVNTICVSLMLVLFLLVNDFKVVFILISLVALGATLVPYLYKEYINKI